MFLVFESQGNYSSALSDANKKMEEIKDSWKPIQFESFSEETESFGRVYYVTVLFHKIQK